MNHVRLGSSLSLSLSSTLFCFSYFLEAPARLILAVIFSLLPFCLQQLLIDRDPIPSSLEPFQRRLYFDFSSSSSSSDTHSICFLLVFYIFWLPLLPRLSFCNAFGASPTTHDGRPLNIHLKWWMTAQSNRNYDYYYYILLSSLHRDSWRLFLQ